MNTTNYPIFILPRRSNFSNWLPPILMIALALPLVPYAQQLPVEEEGEAPTVLPSPTRQVNTGGTWQAQGPGPNTVGQVENILDREVVGAVHAVTPHPSNANILYVGAVNGGIWKTTNALAGSPTWVQQLDTADSLSIGALEFDQTDGSNQTLVAGVGRYSSFASRGGLRTGLLRTTNGGTSWTAINGGGALVGRNISGVVARGSTLVISVNEADNFNLPEIGIFRSTNTGTSFSRISLSDGSSTGLPSGLAHDLVVDPTNTTRLFTSLIFGNLEGGSNGVYRSTDTGASWSKVSDATMDALLDNNSTNNVEFAAGFNNEVYCGIVNSGALAGFFRSANGGTTWVAMDLPSDGAFGIHPGTQGSIHFSIAADPNNANLVYIAGDRQDFPNNVGANDFSGRLFRGNASLPLGSQWVHLTHSNTLGAAGGGTANSSAPHADSRDMDVDANGNLIEVDDGGIYRRTSPQNNTGDWFSANGNIQTTELHNVSYDGNSDILIGGAQDTGTPEQIIPSGTQWRSVSTADGGDVAVDDISSASTSTRYSSTQFLGNFRRQVFNTSNVLQSEVFPALTVIGGGSSFAAQFTTPIKLNGVDATRLIIGGGNSVYESLDQGDTIREIGAGIVVNSFAQDPIAYGATGNPEVLYVGSGSDVFIRTASQPASPLISNAYPGTGSVSDIVIDPDNPNTAFVLDTTNIFQTQNAGTSWTDITGNIQSLSPDELRSIIYITDGSGDAVIVGSDLGVFIAFEGSSFQTWTVLGNGLPTVPVYDLDYQAPTNILIAGTFGRGGWTLDLSATNTGAIFSDGFESGDTSLWSSAVP